MNIYHMHIPRTSGTDILREVEKAEILCETRTKDSNKRLRQLKVYVPGDYEFILPPKDQLRQYNFFTGHFAATPLHILDDVEVFCLMRDPVEQYISTITYQCMVRNEKPTKKFVDMHINNELYYLDVHEPLFNGTSNSQSKFMTFRLVEVYDPYSDQMRAVFEDKELDLGEIVSFVDSHNVGSLVCRDRVLDKLNDVLFDQFGVKLNINKNKENASPSLPLDLTSRQIKKIKEKTQVDEYIYQHIRTKEKKNAKYL